MQQSILPTTESSQPKKRKRSAKPTTETPPADIPSVIADLSAESSAKRAEDLDSLPIPVPSGEEVKLITDFGKRNKSAQAKYPSIKGLPHMVYEGTVKLPAPKSYDKLSPLVALPPRSGKSMVPELGYPLPCEVQGRFTSKYRPSIDKSGLDERRAEAKILLDDYDRSMRSLGKRQPKYTEYPRKCTHITSVDRTCRLLCIDAFKEQLKSDEASKNKAEKKAKKEQEGEKNKPVSLLRILICFTRR